MYLVLLDTKNNGRHSLEYLWTVQSGTRVDDMNSFNGFETLVK